MPTTPSPTNPTRIQASLRKAGANQHLVCRGTGLPAEKTWKTPRNRGSKGSMLDHTSGHLDQRVGERKQPHPERHPLCSRRQRVRLPDGTRSYRCGDDSNAHNRLLLSLAHAVGHPLETFGNPNLCLGGPLNLG